MKQKHYVHQSPSDSHRFGGTVAGDDGDETWVVCVLPKAKKTASEQASICFLKISFLNIFFARQNVALYDVDKSHFCSASCHSDTRCGLSLS